MSNQRTEAEALATCLEYGLIDISQAVTWADSQISNSDSPHPALFDVSIASQSNNLDLAGMLRQLPGDVDQNSVQREMVQCAQRQLRDRPDDAEKIAKILYYWALREKLPKSELRSNAWRSWDAFDLVSYTGETREQIIEQMHESLVNFLGENNLHKPN